MHYYRWQFLLVVLAGWINRHQQDVIEYLKEENRVYRELQDGTPVMRGREALAAAYTIGARAEGEKTVDRHTGIIGVEWSRSGSASGTLGPE